MSDRYEIVITSHGMEFGPGWWKAEGRVNPCPLCSTPVEAVKPLEGPPRARWGYQPFPCMCELSGYKMIFQEGESARWEAGPKMQ